jgi:DNA recombination protein RmuC
MDLPVIAALAALVLILALLFLLLRKVTGLAGRESGLNQVLSGIEAVHRGLEQIDRSVRDEIARNRQEHSAHSQALRSEMLAALTRIGDSVSAKLADHTSSSGQKLELVRSGMEQRMESLTQSIATSSERLQGEVSARLGEFKTSLERTVQETFQLQRQQTEAISSAIQSLQANVEGRLAAIQSENEKKLEQMRQTVDEKLQGTLEARLGESFKQVSDRLEQVYRGLGEMQTLAAGVGDLKRVLANVKTRGTWGEVQLGALLEQMLAPGQYERNVPTSGTGERIEYAIKLPGRDSSGAPVWLPVDAKFPVEDYQRLVEASDRGDADAVEKASRQLEATLKSFARTVGEKYLAPPATTDFGILFLATEGLYAEAVRRTGLAEFIQREYRIVLAGPSTLAALLNSLQMGFRTLAIQQRSSEVWELLGAVKTEFAKYADVLAKLKKKLAEAQNTIDQAETRTRAIHRRLRDVESAESGGLIADEPSGEESGEAHLLTGGGEVS